MSEASAPASNIEEELRLHGVYASNTRGTSMEPLFRTHRDMVIILPHGELKKYDVPLYRNGAGDYVLHRIVGFYQDGYLIRGDNTFVTERVPRERVVGVLSEFVRRGRHHTCTERGYRLYSRIWCFIYPLRYVLFRLRLFLGRIYRAIFKRGKTGSEVKK